MTYLEFINFLPDSSSLAISIISPPQMLDVMQRQITDRWTHIRLDPISVTDAASLDAVFATRLAQGRRFS
ncbi:MAG: hypothetical protein ACLFTK_12925, partial [Anaerolineales bacterium]